MKSDKKITNQYLVEISDIEVNDNYFTSKAVSKKFAKNELGSSIPNIGAFTYIGFDQVLHYVQLVLTWELLIGFI